MKHRKVRGVAGVIPVHLEGEDEIKITHKMLLYGVLTFHGLFY